MRSEQEIRQAIADLDECLGNIIAGTGSAELNRFTSDALRWALGEEGTLAGRFLPQLRTALKHKGAGILEPS